MISEMDVSKKRKRRVPSIHQSPGDEPTERAELSSTQTRRTPGVAEPCAHRWAEFVELRDPEEPRTCGDPQHHHHEAQQSVYSTSAEWKKPPTFTISAKNAAFSVQG